MKSKNKTVVQQSGWSIELLTQWPISASYHHQGWCTSTDKECFDDSLNNGDLWVIFKPTNRRTRPSFQMYLSNAGFCEIEKCGNREIEINELMGLVPAKLREWLRVKSEFIDAKSKERENQLVNDAANTGAAIASGWHCVWHCPPELPVIKFSTFVAANYVHVRDMENNLADNASVTVPPIQITIK